MKDEDNSANSENNEKPEKDNAILQKSDLKSESVSSAEVIAENQAIAEVRAAEKEGEKKGAIAAEKLLKG